MTGMTLTRNCCGVKLNSVAGIGNRKALPRLRAMVTTKSSNHRSALGVVVLAGMTPNMYYAAFSPYIVGLKVRGFGCF
jgi:hypothetical protein